MCGNKLLALPSKKSLAQLAHDDPQAFEAVRRELIEDYINRATLGEQLRLRQLQFRVDGIRRQARSPLGALIKIQALMWENLLRLDKELQRLRCMTQDLERTLVEQVDREHLPARSANVIEFPPVFQRRLPSSNG